MPGSTVTEVFSKRIDHPAAWASPSLGGKEALVRHLSEEHLTALQELIAKTRGIAPLDVKRSDFDHPVLNAFMSDIKQIIADGQGAVIIRGVKPERFDLQDFERIYWGLGTHLGVGAIQSKRGDRLGHVRTVPGVPGRGYLSQDELSFHADAFETVGLMCCSKAASGGESRLVSSLALHNKLLDSCPDILRILYGGHPLGSAETQDNVDPVTHYRFPVYCNVDGTVSCMYNRYLIEQAPRQGAAPLPREFSEAIDYFQDLATSPDLYLEFMLEPGEILLFNNFVMLHSRRKFENSESQQRHYLRLWLDVPDGRQVIRAYVEQGLNYSRQHAAWLAEQRQHARG